MKNKSEFKWNEFNESFLENLKEDYDIYAVSVNDNEGSIILKNNGAIEMFRYENKEDVITEAQSDKVIFETIRECLHYLRGIRADHAVDYNYKDLVRNLISGLYLNKHVTMEDTVS